MRVLYTFVIVFMAILRTHQVFLSYALMDRLKSIWPQIKCIRSGGQWEQAGLGSFYRCTEYYKDGGQPCKSSE